MVSLSYFRGIIILIRIIPVLTWGISASIIGLGFAIAQFGISNINWTVYFLYILEITLIHGIFSHAQNDEIDWNSGTDKNTCGILSGGSGVLKKNILGFRDIAIIKIISLSLTIPIAFYITYKSDILTLYIYIVALLSAFFYTNRIFSLSYIPFAGEWLCGFSGVFVSAIGCSYILGAKITIELILCSIFHALLAISLLMFHHIPDIEADYRAIPKKITTPVYFYLKYGSIGAFIPAYIYLMLCLFISLVLYNFFFQLSYISAISSVMCIIIVSISQYKDMLIHSRLEILMYGVIIGDAFCKLLILVR